MVSEATGKGRANHLLAKIGARDWAQAVSFAYRHGPGRPGDLGYLQLTKP